MSAQLAVAQQREAEVRRDMEEFHGMFEDLSARTKLDEEEIARLRKERDELLQDAGQILESRWPDGWMPRKFLPVCAPISLWRGGFFRSKVMSMIACLPPFWRSVMTYG